LGNRTTGFMTEVLLGNRQFKFSIVFGHEKTPKVGVQHLGVTSLVRVFLYLEFSVKRFLTRPVELVKQGRFLILFYKNNIIY
ncbi:MAG: hypothetical protein U9N57_04160, partial [Pseudomonadota bacterium]|nr:hypothetical protein [Pseudomonadota bacterium]